MILDDVALPNARAPELAPGLGSLVIRSSIVGLGLCRMVTGVLEQQLEPRTPTIMGGEASTVTSLPHLMLIQVPAACVTTVRHS